MSRYVSTLMITSLQLLIDFGREKTPTHTTQLHERARRDLARPRQTTVGIVVWREIGMMLMIETMIGAMVNDRFSMSRDRL